MNEKQLFSALVRGIGVLVFLNGLGSLYIAFVQWEFEISVMRTFVTAMWPHVAYALFALILGAAMVRWPQWFVHLAWLERLPTIGRMTDEDSSN